MAVTLGRSITDTKRTVSFNHLGEYGRLGNMMFQCAAVLGIAHHTDRTPCCNLTNNKLFHDSFKLADLSDRYVAESVAKYERGFEFDAGFYDLESDRNCDLVGFFQSEKYWKVIQGAVRENFCFDSEIKQKAKKLVPPEVATVSIHVRRGDYVAKSKYHHNISLQWYQQAADRFRDCRPIVFSDDIEWCRFNMSFLQDAIFIDHGVEIEKSPDVKTDELGYIDLCAMSLCNKHIIANSSMSWWSAYLGGGETIAPKQWFGVNGPSDWSDVYPEKESWMIV